MREHKRTSKEYKQMARCSMDLKISIIKLSIAPIVNYRVSVIPVMELMSFIIAFKIKYLI